MKKIKILLKKIRYFWQSMLWFIGVPFLAAYLRDLFGEGCQIWYMIALGTLVFAGWVLGVVYMVIHFMYGKINTRRG